MYRGFRFGNPVPSGQNTFARSLILVLHVCVCARARTCVPALERERAVDEVTKPLQGLRGGKGTIIYRKVGKPREGRE
jgi:hypothetical protein